MGIVQVKVFDQFGEVVGVMVHVVALADLRGTTMPTSVVRDHPVAMSQEEQHLGVPVIRRQRPTVTEDDRLPVPPVLVVDLSLIAGRETRAWSPHRFRRFLVALKS